jgi:hypothetical protein
MSLKTCKEDKETYKKDKECNLLERSCKKGWMQEYFKKIFSS